MLKLLLNSSTPKVDVMQAANGFSNYLFLDAREIDEYNISHILNARYVGYKNFSLDKVIDIKKNTSIVVYCSIGKRSEDVVIQLKKAGFINVFNLYGGIFEWVNQDHKVYNNQNIITNKVHAFSIFWGRYLEKGIKVYN